ncbi:MAG: hypothetical protein HXS46_07460 [Theionarchaea archaeon]|nr:hypothetical protein [Theionarchaea archaeon]
MAMRLSPEEKKEKYRLIYEGFWIDPWISENKLTGILGGSNYTTKNRLKEAISQGHLSNPQARKNSYQNTKERVYFVNVPNPYSLFSKLVEDTRISYHALMIGICNMWVVADEEINIKEIDTKADVIFEGYRSDYHVSYATKRSWREGISKMREKIHDFSSEKISEETEHIIQFRTEMVDWALDYEILFKYFKFNLRKPRTPVMREYKIPTETIDSFMSNLDELCTVFTMYYPKGIENYEPWLYMIDTDYPNFIIDVFSELPTTSWFFKVKNKLFVFIYPKRELLGIIRTSDSLDEIENLHVPFLLHEMKNKGIINHERHGIVDGYWQKELPEYSFKK